MKIIFAFITLFTLSFCTPQSTMKDQPRPVPAVTNVPDNYFVGKWYTVETSERIDNQSKKIALTDCDKKSYWEFKKGTSAYAQTFYTAHGNGCAIISASDTGSASVNGNILRYFTGDVEYAVEFQIISEKRFSVRRKEVENGHLKETTTIYEKR